MMVKTKNEYKHLNLAEREQLSVLWNQGLSFRKIGEILNREHTSLSREYRKNSWYYRQYKPCLAQRQADRIAIRQRTKAPLKAKEIYLYVRQHLRMGWSPETIAGRLPLDHPGFKIDDDTIYNYIYNSKKTRGDYLWRYLHLHRKRRMKKNGRKSKTERLQNYLSIGQRPESVNLRLEPFHWETDNFEGVKSDSVVISATVERISRFTMFSKLNDRKSTTKSQALIKRFGMFPPAMCRSLTNDRGPENFDHEFISNKLRIPVYFCNAYHPWEKGTVENTIGRTRRFFPKKLSLDNLSEQYLSNVENYLNHTPRKCLGFKTPYEIMQLQIKRLGALQVRM